MWKGSPVNSLILGPALLFRMPGISTLAVRPSRSASISIGRNKVSHNSEQVNAKTEKTLLKGLQASPEIIVSSAIRLASSACSSIAQFLPAVGSQQRGVLVDKPV